MLKNRLKHDIIIYRKEKFIDTLDGKVDKFLSTSVSKKGVINGNPNVAIIAPKGSDGAYVEDLANKAFKKQREFLLNKENNYKMLYKDMDITICIVEE